MMWLKIVAYALRALASGLMALIISKNLTGVWDAPQMIIFVSAALGGTLGPIIVEMAEVVARKVPPQ